VWGQGENCPHKPEWHCEAHGECRGCECGCDTVDFEPYLTKQEVHFDWRAEDPASDLFMPKGSDNLIRFEPDFPPASIPNEAIPHLAGFINALKPAHYREAAASLRAIADHMPGRSPEFVRGVRYAANLMAHTADDLGAGDG
jgi:hypothetical protein